MTQKKLVPSNPDKQLTFLSGVVKQLRLVWLLFKDRRVPMWIKSVIPVSLLYLISPIDFVPDVLLGFGQLDDFGVILLGMALFVKLCPPDLVDFYLKQLEYGEPSPSINDDETVDTTYRVVGED